MYQKRPLTLQTTTISRDGPYQKQVEPMTTKDGQIEIKHLTLDPGLGRNLTQKTELVKNATLALVTADKQESLDSSQTRCKVASV